MAQIIILTFFNCQFVRVVGVEVILEVDELLVKMRLHRLGLWGQCGAEGSNWIHQRCPL